MDQSGRAEAQYAAVGDQCATMLSRAFVVLFFSLLFISSAKSQSTGPLFSWETLDSKKLIDISISYTLALESNVYANLQGLRVSSPTLQGDELVEIVIHNFVSGSVHSLDGGEAPQAIGERPEKSYRAVLRWSPHRLQFEGQTFVAPNGELVPANLIAHAFPMSRRSNGRAGRLWRLFYRQEIEVSVNGVVKTQSHPLNFYQNAQSKRRSFLCRDALTAVR